jgi:hypothetical protein
MFNTQTKILTTTSKSATIQCPLLGNGKEEQKNSAFCAIRVEFIYRTNLIKRDQSFPWFSLVPIAELLPKFHFALHASYAALPMVTFKLSPQCNPPNVGLNFALMESL